jgi:hypothetical protein
MLRTAVHPQGWTPGRAAPPGFAATSGAVSSWIACPGPMMQNLDLVDVILLAGAIVYFGLVVLRRI